MFDSAHGNIRRGTRCIEDIEIGMIRSLTEVVTKVTKLVTKVATDRDIDLFAEV